MRSGKFATILKYGDIRAVSRKGFKVYKENYQSVSILLIISKIFETIMSKQEITNFMERLLSKYQCGFRRGFSAQNCLLE